MSTDMTAQLLDISTMQAYANGRGYPYDLTAASDVGGGGGGGDSLLFTEDFNVYPLAAPWYDNLSSHDSGSTQYIYSWLDGEQYAPNGGGVRRKFAATDTIDFSCDAMGNSGFAASDGDHIFYFKLSDASDYSSLAQGGGAGNNAFTFYIQPLANGQLRVEWRQSNDTTWRGSTLSGAPHFYAGVMRNIRVVATMNDAGSSNGILKVWVDGIQYIDRGDCEYRLNASEQFGQYVIAPYIASTTGVRFYAVDDVSLSGDYSVVNQAPTDITLTSYSVIEDAGTNAFVGVVNAVDPDAGDNFTYALVVGTGDTDNGLFTLSGSTLSINDAGTAGVGAKSIRIQATDSGGLTFSKQITINVSAVVVGSNVVPISINLTGPGRIAPFLDYSELSGVGTHTFYFIRTHGTSGGVTVDYTTSGDVHTNVSGSLTWTSGDAGIQSVDVPISQGNIDAVDGDHRIKISLSNPAGGVVLHHGNTFSSATGVIDTGKISADAVFYDSAAAGGGDGSIGTPYNNLETAIANVGSVRYLYGKGTTVVDGTFPTVAIGGTGSTKTITIPPNRAGESTRLYIQKWPSNTWTLQGDGSTNNAGFYGNGGAIGSYITWRGLDFQNFDSSASQVNCFAIHTKEVVNTFGSTVEYCTATNINGGATNVMGFGFWQGTGSRYWRCTVSDIKVAGDNTSNNSGCIFDYLATHKSVQRCTMSNAGKGVFFKRPESTHVGDVRFCRMNTCVEGVGYGFNTGHRADNSTIQCNIFTNCTYDIFATINATLESMVITNNTFYNTTNQSLHIANMPNMQVYNNLFIGCDRVWYDNKGGATLFTVPQHFDYYDYNQYNGIGSGTTYYWGNTGYVDAAALNTAFNQFAANEDGSIDPNFANLVDFVPQGIEAVSGGVGGTERGAWLGDFYAIGAA